MNTSSGSKTSRWKNMFRSSAGRRSKTLLIRPSNANQGAVVRTLAAMFTVDRWKECGTKIGG